MEMKLIMINRFVVIPNKNTPEHLVLAKVFDDEKEAQKYAKNTNSSVMNCLDVDALLKQ